MTERTELNLLFPPLKELSDYRKLLEALKQEGIWSVVGLDGSERFYLLAAVQKALGRPILLVEPSEQAAARAAEDLGQLLGGGVCVFPARVISFLRAAAESRELALQRLDIMTKAVRGELRVIVAPADALLHRLIPRTVFEQHLIDLRVDDTMEPAEVIDWLVRAGYERVESVEGRGQCALRGGILDVYPVNGENAIRVEFFDDVIDSIREFDVMTQRSIGRMDALTIGPASEVVFAKGQAEAAATRLEAAIAADRKRRQALNATTNRQREVEARFGLSPIGEFNREMEKTDSEEGEKRENAATRLVSRTGLGRSFAARLQNLREERVTSGLETLINVLCPETTTILSYLDHPIAVFDQPDRLRERAENRILEFREQYRTALDSADALSAQGELLLNWDEVLTAGRRGTVLALNPLRRSMPDLRPRGETALEATACPGYRGAIKELQRDLERQLAEGYRIAILAGGAARRERVLRMLGEMGFANVCEDEPNETLTPGRISVIARSIGHGFTWPSIRFSVIAETDLYGTPRKARAARKRNGEALEAFTDLSIGDYVVHENHGIGRYMGTVRLASEGAYRDFLYIQYQGADKLYVPVDQLHRVQKYIGSEGATPKINSLSGGEWQQQKARVRHSIQEIAGELIKLYAKRSSQQGYAFAPDTPWQRQMEDDFEFEETPDQLTAIEEIKKDMESPHIMDRLLCGDVGFGKTEVALRAIFKCVMSGKQAVLLAPTTILVQQHCMTIQKRFAAFPVRVEMLSRFVSSAAQKKTIERLKNGEVDVVVGTHRLLGKDVAFHDLGLLVIDEEQRFGVRHKEKIKNLRQNVDVLTLSATPIPRTLHMSMVGIRDMSLLETPPEERYPIQTYVVEYSDALVRDAILREMARGGQVYMLHNRVHSIEMMYERLSRLVPEARIAVGHGQMREHALEDVMMDFYAGKYDVLLCTTIIEAGLDVPSANTLIVMDADRFGLSQLYQLRGRVGRSNRLAYAYLTVSPNRILTEEADKRLAAIREFTEFGAGFRVAMRDLEIRGAGNLLGAQQSGHIASVGYDLYVKMIDEAVRAMRGDVHSGDIEARMEIHIDAFLPQDYMRDDHNRVEMYKKIAAIRSEEEESDLIDEMIDRYGDPPKPVLNLIAIALLRSNCESIGVDLVRLTGNKMLFRFSPHADLEPEAMIEILRRYEGRVRMNAGKETSIVFTAPGSDTEGLVREAIHFAVALGSAATGKEAP